MFLFSAQHLNHEQIGSIIRHGLKPILFVLNK